MWITMWITFGMVLALKIKKYIEALLYIVYSYRYSISVIRIRVP